MAAAHRDFGAHGRRETRPKPVNLIEVYDRWGDRVEASVLRPSCLKYPLTCIHLLCRAYCTDSDERNTADPGSAARSWSDSSSDKAVWNAMSTLTDAVAAPLAPGGAAGARCSTADCVAIGVAKAPDPVDADDAGSEHQAIAPFGVEWISK